MVLYGNKGRLYNYLIEIINQHMTNYNFEFANSNEAGNRVYFNNIDCVDGYVKGNIDILSVAEVISMGYNLIKRLGLDDVFVCKDKNIDVNDFFDMLDVYYVNEDNNKRSWVYKIGDTVLGEGSYSDDIINFKFLLDAILNEVMNVFSSSELNEQIDVLIVGVGEEEEYHALKISNELRCNNVNVVINKNVNSKFNIICNEDNLSKGIISVRDNYTDEVIDIDESDVIDYILGNI